MGWFTSVPDTVRISGVSFLPAGEALDDADERDGITDWEPDDTDSLLPDRNSPDRGAEAVYLVARLQLDQMVHLLRQATGVHDPVRLTEQSIAALARIGGDTYPDRPDQWYVDNRGATTDPDLPPEELPYDGPISRWTFELEQVRAGLALHRALSGGLGVSHAFAVDGSITMTMGPQYPGAPDVLGTRGNLYGEVEEEPDVVLDAARVATAAAAAVIAAGRQIER